MTRILKRMPKAVTALAIAFLMVQVGCNLYLPYLTASIVNHGIVVGDIPAILRLGGVMIALTVVSLAGALLNTFLSARISYRLGSGLREDLYKKVLTFSSADFDKFGTASLITRNTNDVTQVQNLIEMGLKFLILCPLYLVGGIFMTWMLSPTLSLVFLAALPLLTLTSFVVFRFANPLYGSMQKLLDSMNLFFREGLNGVKVIRAFRKEQADYEKYEAVNEEYTRVSIKAGTIMSAFGPLIVLVMNLATMAVIWRGAGLANSGSIEIGTIIGVLSYAAQILLGFKILSMVILAVPRGQISARRILEVLDAEPGILDGTQQTEEMLGGDLTFDNISFRYRDAEKCTLEGIGFTVKAGQTLAVIGSTGDGKTTLVNLVSRLYDVEQGSIRIGGVDIRELPQQTLRQAVSVAPQKSTLFFGTVRSNMLLAKPDATDEEIWAALEMACARNFVRALPAGLDAPVEKGGGNFSGGQKQRLCIARALLKEAHVYLFDDSFSALDFKTDAAVRANMKERLAGAVTVIVAQRISTVMQADLIAVLDGGRLAGLGTHQQLQQSNAVYREIIASQFSGEAAI